MLSPILPLITTSPFAHVSIHTGPNAAHGTRRTGRGARTHTSSRGHTRSHSRLQVLSNSSRKTGSLRGVMGPRSAAPPIARHLELDTGSCIQV